MTKNQMGSGVFLVISAIVFGFLSGGLVGSRVFGRTGMGWDRLADALGGMAVGILVSILVSVLLLRTVDTRKLWIASGLFILGAILSWVLLRVVPMAPMT